MTFDRSKVIHAVTLLLALCDGVIANSADIAKLSFIDPRFAQYWPQILCGIVALDKILHIFIAPNQPAPTTK